MSEEKIKMWSLQSKVVAETLQRDGVSFVRREYIDQKYGSEAWIFHKAYHFLAVEAQKRIKRPEGAQYMVWSFADLERLTGRGEILFELEIPREEILLFDLRDWEKILSLKYLGEQGEKFERELERSGIQEVSDVFSKPYYRAFQSKVIKSWTNLLKRKEIDSKYCQGATWKLDKSWIRSKICL